MNETITAVDSTDVLIVGSGPVGLTLAYELARRGIDFRIIDAKPEPVKTSNALAIHARTLEAFEMMGIAEPFIAAGWKAHGVRMSADGGKPLAHIRLDGMDTRFSYILMLWQSETERLLGEALTAQGILPERPVQLTGFTQDATGVTSQIAEADGTTRTIRSLYLVGCDGAHSVVRHLLGLTFAGESYPESFVLGDVALDGDLAEDEMHMYLHADGLLAFFPYGGGRWRMMADNPSTPIVEGAAATPSLADLQLIVDKRGAAGTVLSDPRWTSAFRIHHRVVDKLRECRIFIAGDAAHIHSPAGGQGMNTGIQDAFNLGWKLALAVQGDAAPSLLDSYFEERHPVEKNVVQQTDILTKMATLHSPLTRALRDRLVPLLTGLGMLQHKFRNILAELSVNYRHSPLAEDHIGGEVVHAGDRAPDIQLGLDVTETLYRRLNYGKFVLLIFECVDAAVATAFRNSIATSCGERISVIVLSANFVDARKAYGVGENGGVCLIRPDGYIGFRAPLDKRSVEHLTKYLKKIFIEDAGT